MTVALVPATAAVAADHGDCGDTYTPIYGIQGDGASSPIDGDIVTTEGVVTVAHQANANEIRGFFIQDPDGDGNPATSDGIFVSHGDAWSPSFVVVPGDRVRITGSVDEQFGANTQIEYLDEASFCGGDDEVEPTKIDARTFRADEERFEGMLVQFKKLAVTDTYNLATNGEVWLAEKTVVSQPTEIYGAADPRAADLATDNMARSILLDDGIRYRNPHDGTFLNENGTLRLGDEFRKLTGAVWFDFFQYRIVPNRGDVKIKIRNERPKAPSVGGKIVVGSANVLNYWTTLGGRGADTPEQLEVQTEKLVAELLGMDADILALQEIENDPTHTPILTLVGALNDAMDEDVWEWVGEPAGGYNTYPIRNEIIYRSDRVEPYDDMGPVTLSDPLFDDTPPGRSSPLGRRPFAQTFEADDEVFTVMVNHLKSKGCKGAVDADMNQDDGQSCFNATRTAQAGLVLEFVDDIVESVGDPDVLVVGDMNSYMEEDPIRELETELTNLITKYDKKHYTYNFFAGFAMPWVGRGSLDHAFATPGLAKQVTRTAIWHINADEPRFLDWYDPTVVAPGPYRASDHDPVMIGLTLRSKHDGDDGHGHDGDDGHGHDGDDD